MIPLVSALPATVDIAGGVYPVRTGFRDWMEFEAGLTDPELTDGDRLNRLLSLYPGDTPPTWKDCVDGLLWFYSVPLYPCECSGSGNGGGNRERVYDFKQDAALLYAAFRQVYRIDLSTAELHWWQFRALLDGLPDDCRLAQVMGIRAADLSGLPQGLREHYRKLKGLYALGRKKQTREEQDRNMQEKIERIQKRLSGKPNKSGETPQK